jgi:hypothetical protein
MRQMSSAIIVAIKPSMEYAMLCMSMHLGSVCYSACRSVDSGRAYLADLHPMNTEPVTSRVDQGGRSAVTLIRNWDTSCLGTAPSGL